MGINVRIGMGCLFLLFGCGVNEIGNRSPTSYSQSEVGNLISRAERKDAEAIRSLAQYYEFNATVRSSRDQLAEADRWMRRAAELGQDDDIVRYSNFLVYVMKDCNAADRWHREVRYAQSDDEQAWMGVIRRCETRALAG